MCENIYLNSDNDLPRRDDDATHNIWDNNKKSKISVKQQPVIGLTQFESSHTRDYVSFIR